jgi:hypothetical protein
MSSADAGVLPAGVELVEYVVLPPDTVFPALLLVPPTGFTVLVAGVLVLLAVVPGELLVAVFMPLEPVPVVLLAVPVEAGVLLVVPVALADNPALGEFCSSCDTLELS